MDEGDALSRQIDVCCVCVRVCWCRESEVQGRDVYVMVRSGEEEVDG